MRQQVTRLTLLFVVLIGALIVARAFLVPETFGELGHFRATAIGETAGLEVKYAGRAACAECHVDVEETRAAGRHALVSCEACHGPGADHAEDPTAVQPEKPVGRDLCTLCHGYDPSRPTGFPQIDPTIHNPLQPCTACHEAHAPEPPVTPESCTGCHGQIARTKAVSHHALLACTTCHTVEEEHKLHPSASRPTKPADRSFCGRCHAPDAQPPADLIQQVPRVDFSTHGGHYVCWQCHYPHFPELR